MAMKQQQRVMHKSMQGKQIDMHKLVMQNEMTVAVGNMRVNARGDELGPGGQVIRKREDILRQSPILVPDEIKTQTVVAAESALTITETADVKEKVKSSRKNVDGMDLEGNE